MRNKGRNVLKNYKILPVKQVYCPAYTQSKRKLLVTCLFPVDNCPYKFRDYFLPLYSH